jgi:hypothetical protein
MQLEEGGSEDLNCTKKLQIALTGMALANVWSKSHNVFGCHLLDLLGGGASLQ